MGQKRNPRSWTASEIRTLLDLRYRQLLTNQEVAIILKRTYSSVKTAAIKYLRIKLSKTSTKRISLREQVKLETKVCTRGELEFVELFSQPHTYEMVAKIMNVTYQYAKVRKTLLKKKGYKLYPTTRKGNVDPDSDSPYDRSQIVWEDGEDD